MVWAVETGMAEENQSSPGVNRAEGNGNGDGEHLE